MQVGDYVIQNNPDQPHYGECGQIVSIFWCFITVQFESDEWNFDIYFADELVTISPSTTSLALIVFSGPLPATTVN